MDRLTEPVFVLRCMVLAVFLGLFIGVLTGCARADESRAAPDPRPPPWQLPRFDGSDSSDEKRDKPPGGALQAPPVLNARTLYDLVITCFPSPSWWRPEVMLEARYANSQRDTNVVIQTAETTTYAGVVARVPLYSALELDREREREATRRNTTAQAVGRIEQLLATRSIAHRQLALWRAIEDRSARRVTMGVAETREQIDALTKVAELESQLLSVAADLTTAKLTLIGMCVDRSDVEAAIDRVIMARR